MPVSITEIKNRLPKEFMENLYNFKGKYIKI